MPLPTSILQYGSLLPPPKRIALRAGPLSMTYENGDLRYIRLGEQELIRRIYVAVRDHNWGTAPNVLDDVHIQISEDHFEINYTVSSILHDVHFTWMGMIFGGTQGNITFEMKGEAQTTFLRNRIGFCVLHPLSIVGVNCQVTHLDGSIEQAILPQHVAPQLHRKGRPVPVGAFNEMQAVRFEFLPGQWAELGFAGDIFELEDQRNWIDSSFKTYCTPLRLPIPVEISKGTQIRQQVTLHLTGTSGHTQISPPQDTLVHIHLGKKVLKIPKIGLEVASHGLPLENYEIERLRQLSLSHLRHEVHFVNDAWSERLTAAIQQARVLGVRLEIALFLTDECELPLAIFTQQMREAMLDVDVWWIFREGERTTNETVVSQAKAHILSIDPTARLGGGTDAHLAEFQRGQLPIHLLDCVCFSATPQVHAFDNLSIAETPEAMEAAIRTAYALGRQRSVWVTPITLKQRFNPVATVTESAPDLRVLPSQVDPRQLSLFAAAWMLGTLNAVTRTQLVEGVTYFQTTGWLGIMETSAGSSLPEQFPSIPGSVFPIYHLLADLGEFGDAMAVDCSIEHPLKVTGLALRAPKHDRILIGNLSDEEHLIHVHHHGKRATLSLLDADNAEWAMTDPDAFRMRAGSALLADEGGFTISLPAYALARLDIDLA